MCTINDLAASIHGPEAPVEAQKGGCSPTLPPPPFKAARDEMQVVTVSRAGQPSLVLHHCMQKSICKDMAKLYLKCLRHLGNLGYVAQLPFAVQCTYSEHF